MNSLGQEAEFQTTATQDKHSRPLEVKSKLHTPVMDADEELFDEGDIYDIEEAICDDLGADEE